MLSVHGTELRCRVIMRGRWMFVAFLGLGSCESESLGRVPSGFESLRLTDIHPRLAVPQTVVALEGSSFVAQTAGQSWLLLEGQVDGRSVRLEVPTRFVDFDRLEVVLDETTIAGLGARQGRFEGQARIAVDYVVDGSRHVSPPLDVVLELRPSLRPRLDEVSNDRGIFVNEELTVRGEDFLLGGDEGTTSAIFSGCFYPADVDVEDEAQCLPVRDVMVPVRPAEPFSRTTGVVEFSPRIAGIEAGQFEGTVALQNVHADGVAERSEALEVHYDLLEATVTGLGPGGSLGQFVDVEGGGFVGGEDGLTTLVFEGAFTPDAADLDIEVPRLEVVPRFVSGSRVRYVVDEEDVLGQALEPLGGIRYASGTFEGTMTALTLYGQTEVSSEALEVRFRVEPVKQVVWVEFAPSYVESLRAFGLRAVDAKIRERILEVLERDYEGVNVEFREERPEDFELYTTIDIGGPDPNGLGLLGYDNTPGKDLNNERLFDHIGGVNALTQQDGFPGFGGVFIESVFTFSEHPLRGMKAEAPTPIFDAIFDPFRPDRGGEPVASADLGAGGLPQVDAAQCPSDADRRTRAACAVWALGSLVGSTVSHELGHSLGLAEPYGTSFHNLGDGDNRLMDAGGGRSFEERAQLMGQGPSRFCRQSYAYLRQILPSDEAEPAVERAGC